MSKSIVVIDDIDLIVCCNKRIPSALTIDSNKLLVKTVCVCCE